MSAGERQFARSTQPNAQADRAVRALRRRTLERSARAQVRWLLRAVGWGSIVYLIGWGVVLLIAALQSLAPLEPALAATLTRWVPVGAMGALAVQFVLAARARVTPIWLDRRDLAQLTPGRASPTTLLAWPWWRATLGRIGLGVVVGSAVALTAPRLLDGGASAATAALLLLPSLTLSGLALRWRASLAGGRDPIAWGVAVAVTAAALAAATAAWRGADTWSALAAAPFAALLPGSATTWPAAAAWSIAAAIAVATLALALRSWRGATRRVAPLLLWQSEVLAELRAVALLRTLAAVQALPPDPGARFAAARARAALLDRAPAPGPRWRPRVPRRGATAAFVWLMLVRTWRRSPWSLATAPLALVGAGAALAPSGPFGAAALVPALLAAWAVASLHPGQVGWPGFAVELRARTLALGLVAGLLAVTATTVVDVLRAVMLASPALEGWLLLPMTLAAAALVDLLARQAGDPTGLDVWLLAGVLVATPAALAGWAGLAPGVAAPLLAALWLAVAWLRVVASPRLG